MKDCIFEIVNDFWVYNCKFMAPLIEKELLERSEKEPLIHVWRLYWKERPKANGISQSSQPLPLKSSSLDTAPLAHLDLVVQHEPNQKDDMA